MLDILWKNYKNGDLNCFAQIFKYLMPDLYSYGIALKYSPDKVKDAIQDVFFNLHQNKNLEINPSTLKSYLFRSLKNKLIDSDKNFYNNNSVNIDLVDFSLQFSVENYYISELEQDELNEKINQILSHLSPKQKEIIYLRFIEELPYEEISIIQKTSTHAVRCQVNRALDKIRSMNLDFSTLSIIHIIFSKLL